MFPLQATHAEIKSPKFNLRKLPSLPVPIPSAVGYAWFFENIVIYGDGRAVLHFLHSKKSKNYGEFLGAVKGLIPVDPYCILYQWINAKPTPTIKRYLKRKAFRSLVKKMSKNQPQWVTKKQIKENSKLDAF